MDQPRETTLQLIASNLSLVLAGVVGAVTAVVHGFIMQKHIVTPLSALARTDRTVSPLGMRLLPPLLHVSTLAWLLVGFLLVWAGLRAQGEPRWIVCAAAFVLYGHAAIANALAVRAPHPGWILMGVCVILVAAGARGASGF